MPDWSYHTLFAPLLFRMQAKTAKRLTLSAVSTLGALPGGDRIIDLMGHMAPAPELGFEAFGIKFPTRVGLGCGISESRQDIRAFERFGFGFIEVGPVTCEAVTESNDALTTDRGQSSISMSNIPRNAGLPAFLKSHLPAAPPTVPLLIRIAHAPGTEFALAKDQLLQTHAALPDWVAAIVLDSRWCIAQWSPEQQTDYFKALVDTGRNVVLAIAPDCQEDILARLISGASAAGVQAVGITGGIIAEGNRRLFGKPTQEQSLAMVRKVRALSPGLTLICSGGVIEPADALAMRAAGADLVSLYSGLVFSGPGLPKRINELMSAQVAAPQGQESASPYCLSSVWNSGWLGFCLVGLGLIITGSSAITVGLTTVILPYDETFLGITRDGLRQLNVNLLPFLSHDRVTYAGAGMSCGLLFFALSYFGARTGQKWAYEAACCSCTMGFASFLLFLAYGFLDPLHALATLLLVPFFAWALLKRPRWKPMRSSNLHNSSAWRHGLFGQFLFVCIGAGLLLAGATICRVGSTTVFVPEDLMFMHTTSQQLLCHNSHLLPEIAHDRAGFGGTLVTAGVAVILTALRGFRQGEGWVWWMLLIAGLPGFLSTLGIHFAIGYTSLIHLLPAYIATAMFVSGLALSYRYLCVEPGPSA